MKLCCDECPIIKLKSIPFNPGGSTGVTHNPSSCGKAAF